MFKGKKLSPLEQEAMMKVCQEMMDSMDGMMGEKSGAKKGMKVSVAAPDKKSLAAGLDMAEDIASEGDDEGFGGGDDDDQTFESMAQDDEMSGIPLGEDEDEIDAKIAELMAKKQKLRG